MERVLKDLSLYRDHRKEALVEIERQIRLEEKVLNHFSETFYTEKGLEKAFRQIGGNRDGKVSGEKVSVKVEPQSRKRDEWVPGNSVRRYDSGFRGNGDDRDVLVNPSPSSAMKPSSSTATGGPESASSLGDNDGLDASTIVASTTATHPHVGDGDDDTGWMSSE